MTRADLKKLLIVLEGQLQVNKALGDYDPHCPEIRFLLAVHRDIVTHLIGAMPRPKKKAKK